MLLHHLSALFLGLAREPVVRPLHPKVRDVRPLRRDLVAHTLLLGELLLAVAARVSGDVVLHVVIHTRGYFFTSLREGPQVPESGSRVG